MDRSAMNTAWDAVVIGAGIMGRSVAWQLARAGLGAAPLAPLFWPAVVLTLLSLAANAASPSRPERLLWTPILSLMAVAALGVGLS